MSGSSSVSSNVRPRVSARSFTVTAIAVSVLIACVLSAFASGSPDGLEFVAHQLGVLDAARDSVTAGSPLADYGVVGIDNEWMSVALAGAVGCAITFALAWLVGRGTRRRVA